MYRTLIVLWSMVWTSFAFANKHNASTPILLSHFVQNVTTHVLLHEMGHALIHEFSIPVLGNEENMADSFATNFITQNLRDNAAEIITARAQSWMIEDAEVNPQQYDLKGEHELDKRRAYRVLCLLQGADPTEWQSVVQWANFSERDLADCSDTTPQQIESWKRTLAPLQPSTQTKSNQVSIIYGDGPYKSLMQQSGVIERVAQQMRRFNWPNEITIHFDHCTKGASWNRRQRKILLCDDYIERFLQQEAQLPKLTPAQFTQK